jgi:hypothetical protein
LERMSKDPSAEVRKQAEAASKQIKNPSTSSQPRNLALNNGATGSARLGAVKSWGCPDSGFIPVS